MSRSEHARGEAIASTLAAAVCAWFALISTLDVRAGHLHYLPTAIVAVVGALWWSTFGWRWRIEHKRVARLEARADKVFFACMAPRSPMALPHRASMSLVVFVLLSSAGRLWSTQSPLVAAPVVVLTAVALMVTMVNLFFHYRSCANHRRVMDVALSIEQEAPEPRALRCTMYFSDKPVDRPLSAAFTLFPLWLDDQPFERSPEPIRALLRDVRSDGDSRTFDVRIASTASTANQALMHRRAMLMIAAEDGQERLFVLDRPLGAVAA
jgi:hypothetical protein